jgi:hypothetical protein
VEKSRGSTFQVGGSRLESEECGAPTVLDSACCHSQR